MRAQPAASHWIAGAPFEDAAGAAFDVRYPATGEPSPACTRRPRRSIERAVAARARGLRRLVRDPARRPRPGAAPRRRPDPRPRPRARRARDPRHRQADLRDAGRRLALRRRRARMVRRPRRRALPARRSTSAATSSTPAASRSASAPASAPGTTPPRSPAGRPPRRSPAATRMIFKPSELTPLGALKLGEILAEAGLPRRRLQRGAGRRPGRRGARRPPGHRQGLGDRLGPDRRPRSTPPPPPA